MNRLLKAHLKTVVALVIMFAAPIPFLLCPWLLVVGWAIGLYWLAFTFWGGWN